MTTQEYILAKSKNFIIRHEYETVYLVSRAGSEVIVGDFYGNPECAVIDKNEKWCVIGGCGLIVYKIEESFEEYRYDKKSMQWAEFGRDAQDIWWITELEQTNNERVRFKISPSEKHAGVYELKISDMTINKI